MQRQQMFSNLCRTLGIVLLVMGAMSAETAWAEYETEYFLCVIGCQKSPEPYPDKDACIAARCAQYDVQCSNCSSCPGGGKNTRCTSAGNYCLGGPGAPVYCLNRCWCHQYETMGLDENNYFVCRCTVP